MVDCWASVGKPEPIKTCRFDTRIDYVYATPSLLESYKLKSVQHIDDAASDHNMVIATFDITTEWIRLEPLVLLIHQLVQL